MGESLATTTESNSADFKYDTLPAPPRPHHIRTIQLLDSHRHGTIDCDLQTHPLAGNVPFEALSYVWGDKTDTQSIQCNGRSLNIARDLHDILDRLRVAQTLTSSRLWIDAVSINQQDDEERSQQVTLMKQIYTKAQGLLIWLGLDSDNDACMAFNLAIEIADSCCRVLRIRISDVARINVRQALDQVGAQVAPTISQDTAKWRAIQRLYSREWFRRIWVIQEAHSAKPGKARVFLGIWQIDFDILAVAACWIDWCNVNLLQTGPLSGKVAHVNSTVIKREPYLDSISFQNLLHQTREYESTDPRDKVYAVLGFAKAHKVSSFIRPDYAKPAADVYLDVSRALFESGEGIDVLSFIRHGSTVSNDLPSWVCSFRDEGEYVLAWIPYFSAGGSTIRRLPCVSDRILAIEGFEFDKISTLERTLIHESTPPLGEDDCQTLKAILRSVVERGTNGQRYPTGESLERAISMILTAGLRSANYRHMTPEQHFADFHTFGVSELQISRPFPQVPAKPRPSMKGDPHRYLNALTRVTINRRCFETSQHYLGIGPQSMRVGDVICILSGASTPIVLRPVPGTEGLYQFLGDCYVHGIMFGEALENPQDSAKFEIFRVQ